MIVLYRHLKPCGEVFYIGIGTIKRAHNKTNRSTWWKKVTNKYGYEVDILKRDLTKEEACELEILLIDWYGRKDLGLGTLVNMTDGGEGQTNPSEETREKMRNAKKDIGGVNHHFYGKEKTDEHKQKLREAKLGKKLSGEHKENIKKANERHKDRQPIKYICTKTLKTFKVMTDCAKHLDINYGTLKSYLDKSINLKNTTTIVLYEDYINDTYEQPYIKIRKHIKVLNTETGEVYNTLREAAEKNNIPEYSLRNNLKRNKVNRTNLELV